MNDESFRVEGATELARRRRRDAVERIARFVPEDHGLEHLESADGTGRGVDVELEALHTGFVVERAAAGTAVRQRPPVLALGVVEKVGEIAQATVVRVGSAAHVQRGPVERETIHELGRRKGGWNRAGADDAQQYDFQSHQVNLQVGRFDDRFATRNLRIDHENLMTRRRRRQALPVDCNKSVTVAA